jgi:hypothetical protein
MLNASADGVVLHRHTPTTISQQMEGRFVTSLNPADYIDFICRLASSHAMHTTVA